MRLSEKLRKHAAGELALGYSAELVLLTEAADLLDATTPRPWPPPAGVERCLMWIGRDGWFTDCVEPWLRLPEEVQPDFWLPMPPEPEVDRG